VEIVCLGWRKAPDALPRQGRRWEARVRGVLGHVPLHARAGAVGQRRLRQKQQRVLAQSSVAVERLLLGRRTQTALRRLRRRRNLGVRGVPEQLRLHRSADRDAATSNDSSAELRANVDANVNTNNVKATEPYANTYTNAHAGANNDVDPNATATDRDADFRANVDADGEAAASG